MKRKGRRPAWGKILLAAAVFAGLAAAWRYTPLSELITAERITAWARTVREMKGAPIAVMLAYTPATFLMFPRPLLTLFTVIAFGPWLGFAYGMAGILGAAGPEARDGAAPSRREACASCPPRPSPSKASSPAPCAACDDRVRRSDRDRARRSIENQLRARRRGRGGVRGADLAGAPLVFKAAFLAEEPMYCTVAS